MVVNGGPFCSSLDTSGGGGEVSSDVDILCKVFKTGKGIFTTVYKYNRQDVLVILQSLWVYKYNRQDVLVIVQSLWVYKYNRQDVLVILQSLWVYKYNRQDVLVILRSPWVLKYNRFHSTLRNDVINKWIYMYMKLDGTIWHTDMSCNPSVSTHAVFH